VDGAGIGIDPSTFGNWCWRRSFEEATIAAELSFTDSAVASGFRRCALTAICRWQSGSINWTMQLGGSLHKEIWSAVLVRSNPALLGKSNEP